MMPANIALTKPNDRVEPGGRALPSSPCKGYGFRKGWEVAHCFTVVASRRVAVEELTFEPHHVSIS